MRETLSGPPRSPEREAPRDASGHRAQAASVVAACIVLAIGALEPCRTFAGDAAAALQSFRAGLAAFDEARSYAETHPSQRDEISRRYQAAADRFVAASDAGASTTEVYTNAANSYYFAGRLGEAALYYRRALSVEPSNPAARNGLAHVRSSLPIQRGQRGTGESILRALFFWHDGLAFATRRMLFAALFPLAFAAFAAALWRRRPFVLLGFIFLVPSLALLASLGLSALADTTRRDAVVLVEVEGLRGPGRPPYTASHGATFRPGTEATIIEAREPTGGSSPQQGRAERWLHVRLLDGSDSWIPEGVAEKVIR